MAGNSRRKSRPPMTAETFLTTANSPVLDHESAEGFDRIRQALECEINPQGFIEKVYVSDIAGILWEIMRLRGGKNELLNRKYLDVLDKILELHCTEYDFDTPPGFPPIEKIDFDKLDRLREFAKQWFANEKAREEISKLMGYEIDEINIETAVLKNPPKEIEVFDRAIAMLEFRRDRALKCIFDYRRGFADKIKRAAGDIIDGETVDAPRLEHKAAKKAAA